MYFNNLKKLRIDNDLTQKQIAKELNCKRSSYTNWEYGLVMIPLNIADKLSMFYNVKLSYILGLDNIYKNSYEIQRINYNKLLKNLHNLKSKHKNSYEEIADYLKCDRSTCCRYFKGNTIIPIDRLILLSKFYNVDLDILCGKIKEIKVTTKKV